LSASLTENACNGIIASLNWIYVNLFLIFVKNNKFKKQNYKI
jgi:hypothetical protein